MHGEINGCMFSLVLFSTARPSGTVSCPICMDGYSEVRISVLSSFLCCRRENGAEGELRDSVGFCGMLRAAGFKCRARLDGETRL